MSLLTFFFLVSLPACPLVSDVFAHLLREFLINVLPHLLLPNVLAHLLPHVLAYLLLPNVLAYLLLSNVLAHRLPNVLAHLLPNVLAHPPPSNVLAGLLPNVLARLFFRMSLPTFFLMSWPTSPLMSLPTLLLSNVLAHHDFCMQKLSRSGSSNSSGSSMSWKGPCFRFCCASRMPNMRLPNLANVSRHPFDFPCITRRILIHSKGREQ